MERHQHSIWLEGDDRRIYQVTCRILVDGEARAEVSDEVGPFETPEEALRRACDIAQDLRDLQMPGQARLFEEGGWY